MVRASSKWLIYVAIKKLIAFGEYKKLQAHRVDENRCVKFRCHKHTRMKYHLLKSEREREGKGDVWKTCPVMCCRCMALLPCLPEQGTGSPDLTVHTVSCISEISDYVCMSQWTSVCAWICREWLVNVFDSVKGASSGFRTSRILTRVSLILSSVIMPKLLFFFSAQAFSKGRVCSFQGRGQNDEDACSSQHPAVPWLFWATVRRQEALNSCFGNRAYDFRHLTGVSPIFSVNISTKTCISWLWGGNCLEFAHFGWVEAFQGVQSHYISMIWHPFAEDGFRNSREMPCVHFHFKRGQWLEKGRGIGGHETASSIFLWMISNLTVHISFVRGVRSTSCCSVVFFCSLIYNVACWNNFQQR